MPFPPLTIGDLTVKIPIIQGGMGVGISLSNLAAAVSNQGGIGVIAAAMIGMCESDIFKDPINADIRALRKEIKLAKEKTKGPIGVNIMVALTNFALLVRTAIEEKIDIIFSGAGLPLDLPKYLKEAKEKAEEEIHTKLIPIISSARAASIICKKWLNNTGYLPDAFVVEGPKAGGHLGFKHDEIQAPANALEKILPETVEIVKSFEDKAGKAIPIIAGGGIYTGQDIKFFLELGASGVQLGTRFVATNECDAHIRFKEAFISATEKDVIIIQSPVGMPGRAINNDFLNSVRNGESKPFKCLFQCIKTCDYKTTPYCIAAALVNAKKGNLEKGFVFSGINAPKINKIVSVKELFEQLELEYEQT